MDKPDFTLEKVFHVWWQQHVAGLLQHFTVMFSFVK